MKSYAGDGSSAAETQTSPDFEDNQALVNNYQDVVDNYQAPADPLDIAPAVNQVPEPIREEGVQREHFKALTDEVQRIKQEREAERSEFKQQLELLRANVHRPVEPSQPPRSMFEEIGLKKGDIPTVGEIEAVWAQREANYLSKIEELEVASKRSDYHEVISTHTAELIKQKPHLAQSIYAAQNKSEAAYTLGKMQQELSELRSRQSAPTQPNNQAPSQVNPTAQRIVDNANKPRTLSSVGGQGALSHADYVANMSDTDFLKFASKHMD